MPVLEVPVVVPEARQDRGGLSAQEERIVDGALRCFARWGVAKTTLDDVAREAGYSRATVYRFFPGGKDGLLDAVASTEVTRALATIGARLEAADSLEDLVIGGMTTAARLIAAHKPLQYLLAYEPEVVLPRISFHEADAVLRTVSAFAAPYLSRYLAPDVDTHRAAEWLSRIVLSYVCSPSPAVDMQDEESVRRLVRAFVLPGLTIN